MEPYTVVHCANTGKTPDSETASKQYFLYLCKKCAKPSLNMCFVLQPRSV